MSGVWGRVHAKLREPMTSLITCDVWESIAKAAKAAATKGHVAVTYFWTGASRLLPLRSIVPLEIKSSRCPNRVHLTVLRTPAIVPRLGV